MILAGNHSDPDRLRRFRTEAETIARLTHENIVQIHEIGDHDGMPYLVLEFCEGGSLDRRLDGVPMKSAEAARLVRTLAEAVEHAHAEGIIHRDLKPANILLGKNGTLKVSDFGLAKTVDQRGQTASGMIIGTPEYMAPEQAESRRPEVGPRSDVYALGVILYELLTGRPPFREARPLDTIQKVIKGSPVSPRQLTRETPRDLETICLKAMDKDPGRRYASAGLMAEDLGRWLDGKPIIAQPPSLSYLSAKFARRHRVSLSIAAAAALIFLGGLAFSFRAILAANGRLERQLYATNIGIAERELTQNHDIALAERLLDDCREDLRGWEWRYLRRLLDGQRPPLAGHERGLWMVDYSPDGRHVVTGSIDGSAKIWDAASGALVRSIDIDSAAVPFGLGAYTSRLGIARIPVMCVEYSPDGRYIAAGSFAPPRSAASPMGLLRLAIGSRSITEALVDSIGIVTIWDAATGELVLKFEGQLGVVLSLAYSPDGRRIASSSINPDNSFVVWDAATGEVVSEVLGHDSQIHRLRYSPDGRSIAASDTDGTLRLWDAETFRPVAAIDAHPAPITGMAYSPDGRRLTTGGEDGAVRIWDARSLEPVLELNGHTGSALGVDYSSDGRLIASAGFDKTVRLWDAETGEEKITLRGHTDTVWSVAFSPDPGSDRLASASFDSTARIWDTVPTGRAETLGEVVPSGHEGRVNAVEFSPDGLLLASGAWDSTVRLWDARTGAGLAVLDGHGATVWDVAFSPDGRRLASASWDHTVRVWDVESRACVLSFDGHTAPVHAVAFGPDGRLVASAGFDGQVKIWDATTGAPVANCDGFVFPVLSVAFSPDGLRVASGGSDRSVKVWDAADGTPLLSLKGHEGAVHSVAFSPDGRRVASGGWDRTVRLWDVGPRPDTSSAPRQLLLIPGHSDRVNAVAFSPDGARLASASEDKTVRLWDARDGSELIEPVHHRGVAWAVAFHPDGGRLASGCWYRGSWIRIWDASDDSTETRPSGPSRMGPGRAVGANPLGPPGPGPRSLPQGARSAPAPPWDRPRSASRPRDRPEETS
jgi:WD40 repeat protein